MFHFWPALITVIVVVIVIPGAGLYLVLLERKLAAWVQDRVGPNRVGKLGLFQPIADAFKLLFKEQLIPERVDKVLYLAAPGIAVATTMLAFAVVPFGRTTPPPTNATEEQRAEYQQKLQQYENTYQFVIAPGIDIGIVFIFAVSSLTVYAVLLSGWSSNNKYSFIGGLRSSAQLISYEIPMGMSVLGVVLMAGSLDLSQIIEKQTHAGWNIFYQPLAFVLFLTSAFAECNRLPFDLPEAEQELVAGYHTEYSALKFVFFYLGEYTHLVTTSFLFAILFFGGWHFPWLADPGRGGIIDIIVKLLIMIIKVLAFVVLYMLIRWTLPRFRFDQLMGLAWKVLIPLALANLVCVMVVKELAWTPWLLLPVSLGLLVACAGLAARLPPSPRVATRGLGNV